MGKTAIVLGATGLTGKLLLNRLIEDGTYERIKIFNRRTSGLKHPKLREYLVDLLLLENIKVDFKADEVFCCIGTTAGKTKDRFIYKKIDYGIPVAAAKLCVENKIETFLVISALGANAKSKIFYNRTKGEMEQAVLNLKIKNTYILRPSLINGNRDEKRMGEQIGAILLKGLTPFLVGCWKRYRSIDAERIAIAMQALAESNSGTQIVESERIQELGTHS